MKLRKLAVVLVLATVLSGAFPWTFSDTAEASGVVRLEDVASVVSLHKYTPEHAKEVGLKKRVGKTTGEDDLIAYEQEVKKAGGYYYLVTEEHWKLQEKNESAAKREARQAFRETGIWETAEKNGWKTEWNFVETAKNRAEVQALLTESNGDVHVLKQVTRKTAKGWDTGYALDGEKATAKKVHRLVWEDWTKWAEGCPDLLARD